MHTSSRGFISLGIIIALVVIAALLGGGVYFANSHMFPTHRQMPVDTASTTQPENASGSSNITYTGPDGLFSLIIPRDWTVEKDPTIPARITISSPDYEHKTDAEIHAFDNAHGGPFNASGSIIKHGARIVIDTGGAPTTPITKGLSRDPQAYVDFSLQIKSNNATSKEVMLDGQPAVSTTITAMDDGSIERVISTVRGGSSPFSLALQTAAENTSDPAVLSVWETAIQSFRFTTTNP